MLKLKTKYNNIFFSSDIHGFHKNICYGTSVWPDKEKSCRRFNTPNEMTDHIVNNFNKLITRESYLFLLGDLLFHYKDVDSYKRFINRFNCDNIYLFFGNHCHRKNLTEACEELNQVKFLGDYLEIEIDGRLLCLMHYPVHTWNNRHKTSWHLFGHMHGKLQPLPGENRLDVGIDNAKIILGEYRPFSWEEVIKQINKQNSV